MNSVTPKGRPKWMRIAWYVIIILSLLIYLIVYLAKPDTYDFDKNNHVHYKGDSVTKEDAIKTAEILKQTGVFHSTSKVDVLIKSEEEKDDIMLNFIADKNDITPELEKSLLNIGSLINESVFKGKKVSVIITNNKWKEIKNLGYANTQAGYGKKYDVDANHHVYFKGDGVTESDAKKTGDYFKQIGLFTPENSMDVQIESEGTNDDVTLCYVLDKAKINAENESTFLSISAPLSKSVFNNRKIRVSLVDENMIEFKNLGYATL
jgi:hypothetical protein